jgi:transcriptional regulator with XRE-family HTH domain
MSKSLKNTNNFLSSYVEDNRTKIDESLVSLRLMKEIDDFLEINQINHRDFADNVGYSESYISQLMSGVKKFNSSFINRFEKKFNLKIEFKIQPKKNTNYFTKVPDVYIKFDFNVIETIELDRGFTLTNDSKQFYQLES